MSTSTGSATTRNDGSRDLYRAIDRLARRLPEALQPLASIAYDYSWSWTPGGHELFRALGAYRFTLANENPVRFLRDLSEPVLLNAATDEEFLEGMDMVAAAMAERSRSGRRRPHRLPLRRVRHPPLAARLLGRPRHPRRRPAQGGIGPGASPTSAWACFYRRGYFHQRMDRSGWQHEYWVDSDPNMMPAVRVTEADGTALAIKLPVWDDELTAHIWRVQVGRVPLYLLDAELPDNSPIQRWITSRLYEGNRSIRLGQYALLGAGCGAGPRRHGDRAPALPPQRGPRRAGHRRRRI